MKITVSWYGRCCFLVEVDGKRVLFDPYDSFCNVEIGFIKAEMLLSSSTWHDHGHVGSSPGAWLFTYPGSENHLGFKVTVIEAKENRGTPTVVFNLMYRDISITNFADLGADEDKEFEKSLTREQKGILKSTKIAFMRPSIAGEMVSSHNVHNEKALKYCQPNIIFPEHYFPESFIQEQVPDSRKKELLRPNIVVDEMSRAIGYPQETIDGYKVEINTNSLGSRKVFYKLLRLHPQVKYADKQIKRYW